VELLNGFDEVPDYMMVEAEFDNVWHMRQHPDGRCIALGADNACTIYDTRPTVCRQFDPGCPECRKLQRDPA
jgi:Fe-S-cluster containining protein